jgi:DHA2 family multidrug resistance protein
MMAASRLATKIEPRSLIFLGFALLAATLYVMVGFTADTSQWTIVATSMVQGVGLGCVFVPLNAVAFNTLPAHLRTDGTAILTLMRNIASSIGISVVIANLTRGTSVMHANLAEYITPFNDALRMPDVARSLDLATDTGRALADQLLTQQAALIAYANDFKLLMWLTIAALFLVPLIKPVRRAAATPAPADAMH